MNNNYLTNRFSSITDIALEQPGKWWMAIDNASCERIGLIRFVLEKLKGLCGGYFGPDRTDKEALKYVFIQIASKDLEANSALKIHTIATAALNLGIIQQPDEFEKCKDDFTSLIHSLAQRTITTNESTTDAIDTYYRNHNLALFQVFTPPARIICSAKACFSSEDPGESLSTENGDDGQLDLSNEEQQENEISTLQHKPDRPTEPDRQVFSGSALPALSTSSIPPPIHRADPKEPVMELTEDFPGEGIESIHPINEKDLKHSFEGLRQQLQTWRQKIEAPKPKAEPATWLGALYDAAASWVPMRFQSGIQNLSAWLLEAFSRVPDMDTRDQKILEDQGLAIIDAYEHLKLLETSAKNQGLKPKRLYGEDFSSLKKWMTPYFLKASFLKDYFAHIDRLEILHEAVATQEFDLLQGNLDFSLQHYAALVRELHANEILSERHRLAARDHSSIQLTENIGKRCHYWRDWGMMQIKALMDPFISELEAESLESLSYLQMAFNHVHSTEAENNPTQAQLEHYNESLYCAQANLNLCRQLIASLKTLLQETTTSIVCQQQLNDDLKRISEIHSYLETQLSKPPLKPADVSAIKTLDEIRSARPEIQTANKKRRQGVHRSFKKIETPFTDNQVRFLHWFFFYLQITAPLVQAAMTPVGQRDYQFYLKMMSESSRSGKAASAEESYDHYLAMARGFVGADDEFLNGYDLFLRGQLHVEYQPIQQSEMPENPSLLAAGNEGLIARAYSSAEPYLPKDVANWMHTFFGLNQADWRLGDGNAWDNWSKLNLTPQVRDNIFQALGRHFESIGPELKSAEKFADKQDVPTEYAYYKMYMALKETSPEGRASYVHYRKLVEKDPGHQQLLHDFDVYFEANPPTPIQELQIRSIESSAPAEKMPNNHQFSWLPPETLATSMTSTEEMVNNTLRTDIQFAQTWFPVLSSRFNTSKVESIDTNIKEYIPSRSIHKNLFDRSLQTELYAQNPVMQFLDTPAYTISHKLLLHLVGDFFGQGTELEGISYRETLDYIKEMIHRIKGVEKQVSVNESNSHVGQQTQTELFDELLSKIETAIQLHELIEAGNAPLLAKQLKKSLSQLKPNSSLFFPGGWKGDPSGHAMYYEFIAESDGSYTLRIYNTDINSQLGHAKGTLNYKNQSVVFTETVGIPLENIVRLESLHALIELARLPYLMAEKWQERDIYQAWQGALGGLSSNRQFTEEDLKTPQRAGTCAMMSINAVIREQIPTQKASRKFHWQLVLKGLLDYAEIQKHELDKEMPRRLLSKSVEEVARISISAFEEGAITADELQLAAYKLSTVRQLLDKGEKKYLDEFEKNTPIVFTGPMDLKEIKSISHKPTSPEGLVARANDIPYHSTDVREWIPTAASLVSDFDRFYKQFATAIDENDPIAAINHFEKIIRKLPVPVSKESLWGSLSSTDALKIISLISKSGPLIYQGIRNHAVLHPDQSNMLEPRILTALYKGANIAYQLIELADPQHVPPKGIFFTPIFNIFNSDQTPYFRTYDPLLEDEIQKMELRSTEPHNQPPFPWIWKSTQVPGNSLYIDGLSSWIENYISPSQMARRASKYFSNRSPYFLEGFCMTDRIMPYGSGIKQKIDLPRDIFPAYFYELRDYIATIGALAAIPLDYKNPLLNEPFKPVFAGIDFGTTMNIVSTHDSSEFSQSRPTGINTAGWVHHFALEHVNRAHRLMKDDALELIFLPIDKIGISSFWGHQNEIERERNRKGWRRLDENKNIVDFDTLKTVNAKGKGISLQSIRNLYKLVSHRPSQVKETLSHFTQHPHLLENPDYQTLFKLLMFDRELLLHDLRRTNPQHVQALVKDLAAFTSENYQFYQQTGQPEVAAFFLHVNELFRRYVSYAEKGSKGLASSFMDTRVEIKKFLQKPGHSENIKGAYYQELVLCYKGQESIPEHEVQEFLDAAFYTKLLGPSPKYAAKENELAAGAVFSYSMDSLKTHLEGPQRSALLNGLVETLTGTPSSAEWQLNPAFPYFSSDDGAYTIDIRGRILRTAFGNIVYLPKEVADHPLVEKLFNKDVPKLVERTHPDVYQFRKGANIYRVLLSNQKAIVQKQLIINGKPGWYEYIDEKELEGSLLPLALRQDHLHWVSLDNPNEICITNQKQHSPLYCSFSKGVETPFYKLNSNDRKTNLMLTIPEKDDETARALQRFEEEDYTLIWRKENSDIPHLIEFPRFGKSGLRFHLNQANGRERFECSAFPGYYLAGEQHVPSLKDLSNYLLLQNDNGEQKVLIPRQPLISYTSSSLETQAALFDRSASENLPQHAVIYKVDKKDGSIIPESEEARFYLAMLHLWKMDYIAAQVSLRGTESHLKPLKSEEREVLEWIVNLREISKDHDPRILPISLYAAYLLQKDYQRYRYANDKLTPPSEILISTLYADYLNQLSNIRSGGLKLEEELQILEAVSKKTSAMLNRLQDLAPRKGKEQLAYLAQSAAHDHLIGGEIAEVLPSKAPINVQSLVSAHPLQLIKIPSVEELVDPPPQLSPASLLRPHSVHQHLIEGYYLARGETATEAQACDYYRKLTGLVRSSYSAEDLKYALKIMQPGALEIEQGILLLFEALLEVPDQFPPAAEFNKLIKDAQKEFKQIGERKIRRAESLLENKVLTPLRRYQENKNKARLPVESLSPNPQPDSARRRPEEQTPGSPYQSMDPIYLVSIQPQPTTIAAFPTINSLEEIGVKRFVNQSLGNDHDAHLFEDLQQALKIQTFDPVVKKEFSKALDSIQKYAKELSKGSLKYKIEDLPQFQVFSHENKSEIKKNERKLAEMEMTLLIKANKTFDTPIMQDKSILEQLGGGPLPLTRDDLIQMYWRRDAALFHTYNPNLSLDELFDLHQGIVEYLELATFQQHLKRLDKKITGLTEAVAEGAVQEETDELIKQIVTALTSKRTYKTEEHPEYLVLEYYADILLYQNQVDTLNRLDIKEGKIHHPELLGLVIEMIMGSGKTKVLMPLLMLLHADGEHLSMGAIPEALLTSMASWMAETMGNFKSSVVVFKFDRKTPVDIASLENLLSELKDIQVNRKVLFFSTNSIHSLYLKFIELIHNFTYEKNNSNIDIVKQKELFQTIFKIFLEKGFLIIDEADKTFNPREETLYPLGSPEKFKPDEAHLLELLYRTLDQDPEIKTLMGFEFSSKEGSGIYNKASYFKNIVPILADAVIKQRFGSTKKSIDSFFERLPISSRDYIKNYLTLPATEEAFWEAYDYVNNISEMRIKDLLALAREEILTLLPLTCNKLSNQHYGITSSNSMVIPYHGSDNPALKAQFGSIYEGAHYTIQYYQKYGILVKDVEAKWIAFQAEVMKALKQSPNMKLEEIDAYKKFLLLTDNDPQFTLFGSLAQAKVLTDKINQHVSKKLGFIRDFIIPEITTYPEVIDANPQIFNFLFNAVLGFTGTLSEDVLPEGLGAFTENTVIGKTLGILWQKRQKQIPVIQTPRTKYFAEDLIGKHPELQHTSMLVDVGGYGRGIGNEEVVRQLMHLPCYQKFKGFAFYNKDNELMVLERGTEDPKLLIYSNLLPEDIFYFLDEIHSRGSDTKTSPTTVAIVTIGKHTLLNEGLQGVWRLRGLDKSQQVKFVIDEEVKSVLTEELKELGIFVGREVRLEHLILFTLHRQALQQGDNNYRAFKRKIRAVLQAEIFKSFLDPALDNDALKQLFKDTEELFITKNEQSAWEKFGKPQVTQHSDEAVKEDVQKLKGGRAFKAFTKNAVLVAKNLVSFVTNKIDKLATEVAAILPAQLMRSSSEYGKEVEIETETEKEKESEKEQEKEQEKERQIEFPEIYPRRQGVFKKIDSLEDFKPVPVDGLPMRSSYLDKIPPKAAFVSLTDAFSNWPYSWSNDNMKDYIDIFDDQLVCSSNLLPREKLFSLGQKPVSELLFVKDKMSGKILGAMLDQQDSASLLEMLANGEGSSRISTSFYNFALEPRQGDHPIDKEQLESNPQFRRLLVQAKFFNGETHYKPSEVTILKEWIAEKGKDRMYQFFQNHILQWKDDSRIAFPNSVIGKIFAGL